MVDISLTIVAYNNYSDIITAIDSMNRFLQDDLSRRLYIVDNSSGDDKKADDRKKLLDIIESSSDIEYLDAKKNLGFGNGHNFALPHLDSRYHAIVNPDIIFVQDPFTPMLKYMDENNVGMCIPKITDEDGNIQPVYRKELTLFDMFIRMFLKVGFKKRRAEHTLAHMDYTKPFQVPFGQGSFLVIKTELFKKLGGFDDRYFMYIEDADLCKRVNAESRVMYFPDATVIHKWEKGSHKNKTLFKYHIDSTKKYFKKWGIKWF